MTRSFQLVHILSGRQFKAYKHKSHLWVLTTKHSQSSDLPPTVSHCTAKKQSTPPGIAERNIKEGLGDGIFFRAEKVLKHQYMEKGYMDT